MSTRPEPLVITGAVLTTLDVLAAGAALGDLIGPVTLGLFVLGTKALNAGFVYYTRGQVTPLAAPQNADGVPLVPLQAPPGE